MSPTRVARYVWLFVPLSAVLGTWTLLAYPGLELVVRVLAAVADLLVGLFLVVGLRRRLRQPRAWLVADSVGLFRLEGGRETALVHWSEVFGATVLAHAHREVFALALTSASYTRFVPVRAAAAHERASAPTLLERAATVAQSDLHPDDEASLSATDAEQLLSVITQRAPGALDRVVLADAAGEPVVLDRIELRLGNRRIDLSSPLEWRAFAFQELGTQAAWLLQATWVRQGDAEVFLVAPMPADASSMRGAPDAKLLPSGRGEPPPRELRRAVDHIFMLPLRRALDRAPRVSRVPPSPSRAQPEGRA
jgi:hypothetical protein